MAKNKRPPLDIADVTQTLNESKGQGLNAFFPSRPTEDIATATPLVSEGIREDKQTTNKIAIKKASKHDSTLAKKQDSMQEMIRKTVKSLGKEVSFIRLTPQEKGRLADIVYTYKRQGIKTSENEINRIAINFLIEDFNKNGKESMLAQVLEALNA